MKNAFLLFALGVLLALFSCNQQNDAWSKFVACGANACVAEAIAVQEAFLDDPQGMLAKFQATYEKGDDHVIGWLYLLRDSVLFNSAYGSTQERFDLQQRIVEAAQPFANDPKLGEMANSVIAEIGNLAIASELEDGPEISPTGTYSYELPQDGGSGELQVLATGENTIRFRLTVVGGPPAHNQGTMEGSATINDEQIAEILLEEYGGVCRLQLQFDVDQVLIKTLEGGPAECGFGNGVTADGTYTRSDDLDPFRAEGGDEVPAELSGRWQSTIDPKSEVLIENGMYKDIYEGKELSSMAFSYHKKCPEDCGPNAGDRPCLRAVEQDIICYTILKLDAKALEMSMIGGRGNTLSFRRK